jgi:hypothetical protein
MPGVTPLTDARCDIRRLENAIAEVKRQTPRYLWGRMCKCIRLSFLNLELGLARARADIYAVTPEDRKRFLERE